MTVYTVQQQNCIHRQRFCNTVSTARAPPQCYMGRLWSKPRLDSLVILQFSLNIQEFTLQPLGLCEFFQSGTLSTVKHHENIMMDDEKDRKRKLLLGVNIFEDRLQIHSERRGCWREMREAVGCCQKYQTSLEPHQDLYSGSGSVCFSKKNQII